MKDHTITIDRSTYAGRQAARRLHYCGQEHSPIRRELGNWFYAKNDRGNKVRYRETTERTTKLGKHIGGHARYWGRDDWELEPRYYRHKERIAARDEIAQGLADLHPEPLPITDTENNALWYAAADEAEACIDIRSPKYNRYRYYDPEYDEFVCDPQVEWYYDDVIRETERLYNLFMDWEQADRAPILPPPSPAPYQPVRVPAPDLGEYVPNPDVADMFEALIATTFSVENLLTALAADEAEIAQLERDNRELHRCNASLHADAIRKITEANVRASQWQERAQELESWLAVAEERWDHWYKKYIQTILA